MVRTTIITRRGREVDADLFWCDVVPAPDSDCLLYVGGCPTREDYGRFRGKLAHRASYEVCIGPIPDETPVIDHVRARGCIHHNCVNPDHLEAVTVAENNRRLGEAKTHCAQGHDWSDPRNVARRKDGRRWCAECNRQRWHTGKWTVAA
jgi:hypothetical protein